MATPLEELAAAILQKRQEEISGYNPYAGLQSVADLAGESAIKLGSSQKYGLGETLLTSGLAGLASGILGNYAGDYQNTLTDRYERAATSGEQGELPSGLFSSARNDYNLFKAQQDAMAVDDARRLNLLQREMETRNEMGLDSMEQEAELRNTLENRFLEDRLNRDKQLISARTEARQLKPSTPEAEEALSLLRQGSTLDELPIELNKALSVESPQIGRLAQSISDQSRKIKNRKQDMERVENQRALLGYDNVFKVSPVEKNSAEAEKLRTKQSAISSISQVLDSYAKGSPLDVTGLGAVEDKISSSFLQAAITSTSKNPGRLTQSERALLQNLVPGSLAQGKIGQVTLDALTGREREAAASLLKRVLQQAQDTELALTYGEIRRGGIYDRDTLKTLGSLIASREGISEIEAAKRIASKYLPLSKLEELKKNGR